MLYFTGHNLKSELTQVKLTRLCGEEHPDTVRAMSDLANSYGDLGKLDEAASMRREVLEMRRKPLGDEHPDTIRAMANLKSSPVDQGEPGEATSTQREASEKGRRILGEKHLDTIMAMGNLANSLRD